MNRWLCIILALLTTSCGPNKALKIPLAYSQFKGQPSKEKLCSMNFSFKDSRLNKTLGQTSGFAILSDTEIDKWIKSASQSIFGKSIQIVKQNDDLNDNEWLLELKKVYVSNQTTNIAATIVLVLQNHKLKFKQIYRGNVIHTNWSSSSKETMDIMNSALTDSLKKIENNLASICQISQ